MNPYDIDIKDVKEVWKFVNYISSEMPEANMEKDELVGEIKALRKEVKAIQMKLEFEIDKCFLKLNNVD